MNKKLFISVIAICLICFSPRSLIYAKSYKFYETILFYSDNYTQVEVCCSYDYSDGNWACSIIDSANAGQISAGYKAVKGQNIAGGRDTVESISKQYFYIIDGNENVIYSFYIYYSIDIYGEMKTGHVVVSN